jgi:hypothetical protein
MEPPRPDVANPVPISIIPVFPELEVPEEKTSNPLTP